MNETLSRRLLLVECIALVLPCALAVGLLSVALLVGSVIGFGKSLYINFVESNEAIWPRMLSELLIVATLGGMLLLAGAGLLALFKLYTVSAQFIRGGRPNLAAQWPTFVSGAKWGLVPALVVGWIPVGAFVQSGMAAFLEVDAGTFFVLSPFLLALPIAHLAWEFCSSTPEHCKRRWSARNSLRR